MRQSACYIITKHTGREGVTLSLLGQWGNTPYPTADDALRAAIAHARSQDIHVEREHFK